MPDSPRLLRIVSIAGLAAYLAWMLPGQLSVVAPDQGMEMYEGGVLDTGLRMLHGDNPYPDPLNDRAIALPYPPVAPLLFAAAYEVGGRTYAAPRMVSVLAVFGTAALLGLAAARRWGALVAWWAALAWLGLQCTFSAYLFLVRVDSVQIFFTVAALLAGERLVSAGKGAPAAATLAALAFYVKPTSGGIAAAVALTLAWRREWRAALVYGAITAGLVLAIGAVMHVLTAGWHTFALLMTHRIFGEPLGEAEARRRLLCVPDSWCLGLMALLGWKFSTGVLRVGFPLTLAFGYFIASKSGGLSVALTPGLALGVAMAANGLGAYRTAGSVLALAYPALLLFSPVPSWGQADVRAYAASKRAVTAETTRVIKAALAREPGGATLVLNRVDCVMAAGAKPDDDILAAISFDITGAPALEHIARDAESRRYAVVLADPATLKAFGAGCRERGCPESGARLERIAAAIEAGYRLERKEGLLDSVWVR